MSNEEGANSAFSDYQAPRTVEEIRRRYANGERYFGGTEVPDGSDLANSSLEGAVFQDAWISDADLSNANLRNVNFDRANVKCTDFRGADLQGATFKQAAIEGADFTNALLEGATFVGSSWYGYLLKEGECPIDALEAKQTKAP